MKYYMFCFLGFIVYRLYILLLHFHTFYIFFNYSIFPILYVFLFSIISIHVAFDDPKKMSVGWSPSSRRPDLSVHNFELDAFRGVQQAGCGRLYFLAGLGRGGRFHHQGGDREGGGIDQP
jgi:hypothetical protein